MPNSSPPYQNNNNDNREFIPQWPNERSNVSTDASQFQHPNNTETINNSNFTCYGCGQLGHISKYCPNRNNSANYQGENQNFPSSNRVGTVGMTRGGMMSYLPIKLGGKYYEFITDTGSCTTLVLPSMVIGKKIIPTNETIAAINGKSLAVIGAVEICVRIGRHSVWIRALVSDQIDEPTLGRDFMINEGICFNMGSGEIRFRGDWIKLIEKPWIFAHYSEKEIKREFKSRLHCSGCGRNGHIQKTCRSNRVAPPSGQLATNNMKPMSPKEMRSPAHRNNVHQGQPEQRNLGTEFHCYGCGQYGHKARHCPSRQRQVDKSGYRKENTLVKCMDNKQKIEETSKFLENGQNVDNTEFMIESDEPIIQISANGWTTRSEWGQERLSYPTGCIVA